MSLPKVPRPGQAAKNKEGPQPEEHVQLFRMERDHNKGFHSEKRQLEASTLCTLNGLVILGVLPPLRNLVAPTERCVQQTLPFGRYCLRTKLFVGHGGGGGL